MGRVKNLLPENIEELRRDMHQMLTASDREMQLIEENARLREALADIANIINPYEDGDTMQEIARAALGEVK
jgi:prophage maintenance system killer protein